MSRPFPPLLVPLVLLLLTWTSAPATVAAEAAEAPSAVGCSQSAEAASRVVAESCTDDIVRSFFGLRGSDACCRALETAGAEFRVASNMSRPFPPLLVPLVLLLLTWTSAPATAAAEAAEVPSAIGCSRSAEAASRVVAESCTDNIVRSFFGLRGSDACYRALETADAGCYRAVFSGSPFADLYATILGNVCGLAVAPSPGELSYY